MKHVSTFELFQSNWGCDIMHYVSSKQIDILININKLILFDFYFDLKKENNLQWEKNRKQKS